jgi:hypothetical protein
MAIRGYHMLELIRSRAFGVVVIPQKIRIDGVIELQIAPYHTNIWLSRSTLCDNHANITPPWSRPYLIAILSYGAKARLQHLHPWFTSSTV